MSPLNATYMSLYSASTDTALLTLHPTNSKRWASCITTMTMLPWTPKRICEASSLKQALYTCRAISDHLGKKKVYKRLFQAGAFRHQSCLRYQLFIWLSSDGDSIKANEALNPGRDLRQHPDKLVRFRMTTKMHNPHPPPRRPVQLLHAVAKRIS